MMNLFKKKNPTPEELEQFGLFIANHHPWKVMLILICVTIFPIVFPAI
jgi:hypothetical protein